MILTVRLVLLVVVAVQAQNCYDDGNEFCIDDDDILAVDLLPGSFFLMEQYNSRNLSRSSDDNLADGSFGTALDEMEYHRKRMNEFLCHGYVAEEIFKEIGPTRIKRRNALMFEQSIPDFLEVDNFTIHDKLLSDEGSSKYKNWLQRTTTLDDVYRHYSPHDEFSKKHEVYEDPETEGEIEEFDEEEVNGYIVPTSISLGKIGKPRGQPVLPMPTDYGYLSYGHRVHSPRPPKYPRPHEFLPTIHEQHIYLPNHHHEDHHRVPIYHSKGKGHDLSIKDFFEIALTALAFLAFGLFVIQLLMNVTNPLITTTANSAVIDQRYRRHVFDGPTLAYADGNAELNELAHRVLRSIESVLVAQSDAGNCLRHFLCKDNRYSRDTQDGQRIWIPVWSVGMSWATGRVMIRNPWSAMLESLKASVLGLGRADCETLYPNCDLWKERTKRRRRRRK